MEAVQGLRKARDSSGKRGLTLHCCISITEEVKINDQTNISATAPEIINNVIIIITGAVADMLV